MLKNRITILPVLIAFSALVVTGCYRTPEQRAEHYVQHMAKELKLDDAQKARLEQIKDEFLALRPWMAGMREETVREASELMRSSEIDKGKLEALKAKNRAQADDMIRFFSAKFTEIHDMLTPEQRDKLVTMLEKHMGAKHMGK
ncbi:MAG TPA: Spy/CpxP family protein refolding chaperone [Nitrospirota bacterium]|nr:Spy/CpxP family protein refolding chaperone [Nitrospirota bacterium]